MDFSVNQRVRELIEANNLKPNTFATKLGLDRATKIYNIVNDKTGVSANMIELIANKFANINAEWLMTGKGKMYKDVGKRSDEEGSDNDLLKKEIATLKSRIAKMEEEAVLRKSLITSYEYQIKRLTEDLEKLKKAS